MSRLRLVLLTGFFLAASRPETLLAQFPYEGVTTSKVKVRSGPTENHYATAYLEQDTRVTVVLEEPNGWLAIEPPEGSFSWISGEFVREISRTEGEVIGTNVLVRVGTLQDAQQREVWQKKLNRGDRVKILEKTSAGEGRLTKIWYKIAPPAGEVRYVSSQYVQPVSGRRPAQRPAGGSAGQSPPRDLGTEETGPRTKGSGRTEPPQEADDSREAPQNRPANRTPRTPLEKAEAAYKEMMQKPPAERDIAAVRTLYEKAAQSAKTDADHSVIVQRLELLQAQEERQAKYVEFDRALKRSKQRDETLLTIPKKKNESTEAEESKADSPPRYDASGLLRRSTAVIDGKPAYVLVSPQGGIRYYVTASPGIDLNKYLDKLVAVRGPSNYRMEVRAQHITVRDVTPLDLESAADRATRR